MNRSTLQTMPLGELWALHEKIGSVLTEKLEWETRRLHEMLADLRAKSRSTLTQDRLRRAYPKVVPKFQNPAEPSQTWAGRGKQPRWVSEMLNTGKSMDDLRIPETA
jgi:DNA-binding protein H-NS